MSTGPCPKRCADWLPAQISPRPARNTAVSRRFQQQGFRVFIGIILRGVRLAQHESGAEEGTAGNEIRQDRRFLKAAATGFPRGRNSSAPLLAAFAPLGNHIHIASIHLRDFCVLTTHCPSQEAPGRSTPVQRTEWTLGLMLLTAQYYPRRVSSLSHRP